MKECDAKIIEEKKVCSSWLHFKIHRLIEYVKFYPQYIRCKLFHEQESPKWESCKGAILCTCGIGIDLGISYGQHYEKCYNRITLHSKGEGLISDEV